MKYLVLCGGGPNCVSQLAMINELVINNKINIDNIKKIYSTSGGSIISAIIALRIPMDESLEYIINRPWNKIIKFDIDTLLNFNHKKGFYDYDIMYKVLQPLLSSNDISMDITLEEIYNLYNIELRMITTELDSFKMVELSYLTHPTLKLMNAIMMSISCPPIFSPFMYEGKYYIDGGIYNNYPVDLMLRDVIEDEHDLILGINIFKSNQIEYTFNYNEMNSYDYMQYIMIKCIKNVYTIPPINIKHELLYDAEHLMYETELFTEFINNIEYRKNMINKSKQIVYDYENSLCKNIFNVEKDGLAS